jgi:glycosyltransferase involved in cell wall biosynthesis
MTTTPDPRRDLTVVIPTRDRPDLLASCVAALAACDVAPAEVLVVDSASTDASSVEAAAAGATVVRCDLPGASRARNAGWRAARTSIVAFVDDDVRVTPDWPSRICEPFGRLEVVVVTGAVVAGSPVRGAGPDVQAVAVTDDVRAGPFDRDTTGNVGASANLAARRRALESVGGFDVALGAGGRFRAAEDIDLVRRLLDHGGGWHAADAVGFHDQWRGRRALVRLDVEYGFGLGIHLAKVVREDRRRAARLVRYEVGRYVRDVRRDARRRYRFGLLRRTLWFGAALAGTVRGLAVPVCDGHLQLRARRH